jgi:hypothetical protein
MNVEIGAEATQFPVKEYVNGIAVAVCSDRQQFEWKLTFAYQAGTGDAS